MISKYLIYRLMLALPFLAKIVGEKSFPILLASILKFLSKSRYQITKDNLQKAFAEKDLSWIGKTADECYKNLAIVFTEILLLSKLSKEEFQEKIKFENIDLMIDAHKKGKGLLILSAHLGNWEYLALGGGLFSGLDITLIAKEQKNPFITRHMKTIRERWGNKTIFMQKSARQIVSIIKSGGVVAMLADQSPDPKKNISVDFFGRQTPSYEAPASIALRLGCELIYGFTKRDEVGNYIVHFKKIETSDIPSGREGVKILTQRHTKMLEDEIKKEPSLWVWQHKRWKHTPTP
jgi:Kdo2-lipid IVA lauroyltransferase/acyltransferase